MPGPDRQTLDTLARTAGDALAALATEVTQALNEQVEAMQRRVQLRGSDDDASDG